MSQRSDHHELGAGHQEIETSSDRSFGLVFAVVFALLAGYFGWLSWSADRISNSTSSI